MQETLYNWYYFIKEPMNMSKDSILKAVLNQEHSLGQRFTTAKGEVYVYGIFLGNNPVTIGTDCRIDQENYNIIPIDNIEVVGNAVIALDTKPNTFTFVRLDLPGGGGGGFDPAFLQGEIEDLQREKSDIYHLSEILPSSELQPGYNILNSVIDFSDITPQLLQNAINEGIDNYSSFTIYREGSTGYYDSIYFSFAQLSESSQPPYPDTMWRMVCNGAQRYNRSHDISAGAEIIFYFNTVTQVIGWQVPYAITKKYTFTPETFDVGYPSTIIDHLTSNVTASSPGKSALANALRVTSGTGTLDVDCEFLHNQISTLDTAMTGNNDRIEGLIADKSDIYHPELSQWYPIRNLNIGDNVLGSQINFGSLDNINWEEGQWTINNCAMGFERAFATYVATVYNGSTHEYTLYVDGMLASLMAPAVIVGKFLIDVSTGQTITGWEFASSFLSSHPDKIYTFTAFIEQPDAVTITDIWPAETSARGLIFDTLTGRFAIDIPTNVDCQWLYENMPSGGGGEGTSNYNLLENKPKINSVELKGNKTSSNLGLVNTVDFTDFSSATNTTLTEHTGEIQTLQTEISNKSDIYHVSPVVFTPLADMVKGTYLLGSVLDFSSLTQTNMENVFQNTLPTDVACGIPRAPIELTTQIASYILFYRTGEPTQKLEVWVNGTYMDMGTGIIVLGATLICTYYHGSGTMIWEGSYGTSKQYVFTSFATFPEYDISEDIFNQSLLAVLGVQVKASPIDVDCEWLYEHDTESVAELEEQVKELQATVADKSDVYHPLAIPTSLAQMPIGCELIGITLDFNQVTDDMIRALPHSGTQKIFGFARNQSNLDNVLCSFWDMSFVNIYANGIMSSIFNTSTRIASYNPSTDEVKWLMKTYSFEALSPDPQNNTYTGTINTIDGDNPLDFEFFSNVQYGVGTSLFVDCGWLYNNSSGGGGTASYNDLIDKPRISDVELTGNKLPVQLGLATTENLSHKSDIYMATATRYNYSQLALNTDFLGFTIDFSDVTDSALIAMLDFYQSGLPLITRSQFNVFPVHIILSINSAEGTDEVVLFVNGDQIGTGMNTNSTWIVFMNKTTQALTWNSAFADRKYTFNTFTTSPELSTVFWKADPSSYTLIDGVTNALHFDYGSAITAVDCEWLYKHPGGSGGGVSDYTALTNTPSIDNHPLLGGNQTSISLGLGSYSVQQGIVIGLSDLGTAFNQLSARHEIPFATLSQPITTTPTSVERSRVYTIYGQSAGNTDYALMAYIPTISYINYEKTNVTYNKSTLRYELGIAGIASQTIASSMNAKVMCDLPSGAPSGYVWCAYYPDKTLNYQNAFAPTTLENYNSSLAPTYGAVGSYHTETDGTTMTFRCRTVTLNGNLGISQYQTVYYDSGQALMAGQVNSVSGTPAGITMAPVPENSNGWVIDIVVP
jgi:hypothetical protein